jgi:purine nucleosidase
MLEEVRVRRLEPPVRPVRVVVDTDAANEIDDQFALAYAVLSEDRLAVEAVYAGPFQRSAPGVTDAVSPGAGVAAGEGMSRSYDEILRVLDAVGSPSGRGRVHRGAESWLS